MSGTGEAGGVVEQGANPAQPNIPFALTPALINNDILDYSDPATIKQYHKAIQPMTPEFDMDPRNLRMFLENLRRRAVSSNWMPTLTINRNGEGHNLIDDYGALSYEDVMTHVQTYIGQQNRNAQNSMQIYECVSSSLTEAALAKVSLESTKYVINNTTDGVLFLKVVIGLSHIDTRATVSAIRMRLSSLDTKMAELQDNIIEFNEHVKTLVSSLQARGERTLDLLVNLFKGYKAVSDKKFVQYIEQREDEYNDGRLNLTADELMTAAELKYKTMVENGLWKQPSPEEQRIVALVARIDQMKKKQKPEQRTKHNNNQTVRNKKREATKSDKKPWWWTPPKDDEKHEKEVKGKTYYWCRRHGEDGKTGKWVRHKESEHKELLSKNNTGTSREKNSKDEDQGAAGNYKGKLRVSSYQAVVREDSDDEF